MQARDRILFAAKAIYKSAGLEGLSIRTVAQHAEMSPMGIYRHFPNKGALIDALMLDGFAAWEATVGAIDERDPVAWLERLLATFLEFALTDPHRFNAAFLLRAQGARKYPEDFAASNSPVVRAMVERIEEAKAVNRLGDAPSDQVALTLSALAQGLVSMERAGRFSSEAQFRAAYETTMSSCLCHLGIA